MMKFVITPRGANVWVDGKAFTIPSSHPRWAILSLGFKLKNEPLVSWVLEESERELAAAAACDPRFRVTNGWLAWDNNVESMTPQLLPTAWLTAVQSWVTAEHDLVLLSRFLERSTASQWELAAIAVGTDLVLNWDGHFKANAEKQADGTYRLGKGGPHWIDPSSLSAPAGYVLGTPLCAIDDTSASLASKGRVLDSTAGVRSFRAEAWTGKVWKELFVEDKFILALDNAQTEAPNHAKVRLLAANAHTEAVIWAEQSPLKGFLVTLQEGVAPRLGKEQLIATTYSLPEAQAIARHLDLPGVVRIKRDEAILVELTN